MYLTALETNVAKESDTIHSWCGKIQLTLDVDGVNFNIEDFLDIMKISLSAIMAHQQMFGNNLSMTLLTLRAIVHA